MATLYCYIDNNGNIATPRLCPTSTSTISNFHLLSDLTKIQHGYYPAKFVTPEYNSTTHRLNGVTKELIGNKVVCTYQIEEIPPKTPQQILSETDQKVIIIIDHLIDALVARGVMTKTDLPIDDQTLLKLRADTRKLL